MWHLSLLTCHVLFTLVFSPSQYVYLLRFTYFPPASQPSGMWCCFPKLHLCDPHLTEGGSERVVLGTGGGYPVTSTSTPTSPLASLFTSAHGSCFLRRLGWRQTWSPGQFFTLKNIQPAPVFRRFGLDGHTAGGCLHLQQRHNQATDDSGASEVNRVPVSFQEIY